MSASAKQNIHNIIEVMRYRVRVTMTAKNTGNFNVKRRRHEKVYFFLTHIYYRL